MRGLMPWAVSFAMGLVVINEVHAFVYDSVVVSPFGNLRSAKHDKVYAVKCHTGDYFEIFCCASVLMRVAWRYVIFFPRKTT